MSKRVVITGYACITPLGLNQQEYWENSIKGLSATGLIEEACGINLPDYVSRVVGQVKDFNPEKAGLKDEELMYDRSVQFALVCLKDALDIANLKPEQLEKAKTNVHLATAIGNINLMEDIVSKWSDNQNKEILYSEGKRDAELVNAFQFNNVADVIRRKYGIAGECSVIATGCTGGVDALGYSYHQIKNNNVDIVFTGSTEAPITPLVISSFSKINATTKRNDIPEKASRPFDQNRDGFVLSEGCGIFILESLDYALSRGAKIYAEIVGYGSCSNALHMTDIPEDGKDIMRSMKMALDDAEISFEDIDYVNLHGSSTPQNDLAERNALSLLSDRYNQVPVTSNKSQVGHALAASNSIEVVSCIKTLESNLIPPTINLEVKDQRCDLNVVTKAKSYGDINYILKNSSGFSGIHSALVLKKFREVI